jgi:hypothetical protein
LDESAIKSWWNKLINDGQTEWCTLGPNCSTITAFALDAAGAQDLGVDYFSRWNIVWTPNDVRKFAEGIVSAINDARAGPPAAGGGDGGVPGGT